MTILYDKVMGRACLRDARKHARPTGDAETQFNALSNVEVLQEISDALDEILQRVAAVTNQVHHNR